MRSTGGVSDPLRAVKRSTGGNEIGDANNSASRGTEEANGVIKDLGAVWKRKFPRPKKEGGARQG